MATVPVPHTITDVQETVSVSHTRCSVSRPRRCFCVTSKKVFLCHVQEDVSVSRLRCFCVTSKKLFLCHVQEGVVCDVQEGVPCHFQEGVLCHVQKAVSVSHPKSCFCVTSKKLFCVSRPKNLFCVTSKMFLFQGRFLLKIPKPYF